MDNFSALCEMDMTEFKNLDRNKQTAAVARFIAALLDNFPAQLNANQRLSALSDVFGYVLAQYDEEPTERIFEIFKSSVEHSFKYHTKQFILDDVKGSA